MRLGLVVLLALCGCVRGSLDSNFRPAVIPKLSELPSDPARRNNVLEASHVTSGPEQEDSSEHQQLTKKQRRAVGTAAFAAAVLGSLYSTTENVTLGGSIDVDENEVVAPSRPAPTPETKSDETAAEAPATDPPATKKPLLPWVKLK